MYLTTVLNYLCTHTADIYTYMELLAHVLNYTGQSQSPHNETYVGKIDLDIHIP